MKTRIIAEIGINHLGDIDLTKKLIDIAAFCGCWAVKFQKRNPDVCVPEHQKNIMKKTPWGEMTYLDYKYRVEFGLLEYQEIDRYCKEKNIFWSASVWDMDSLCFISENFPHVPFIKIPSAKLTDLDLISKCAEKCNKLDNYTELGCYLIISTGMSTEEEIDAAYDAVKNKIPLDKIVIMHCNSTYPAPNSELNMKCITTLKEKYPEIIIGYSDHAFGIVPSLTSVVLGSRIVEKHITLDRTMWGSDQLCSCEPHGLIKLSKDIREVEESLGDGIIKVYPSEEEKRKSLRG